MKGYKIFTSEWKCRDTQYAVGATTEVAGPPVVCKHGLHFCANALDCIMYYALVPENKYAEVEAVGDVVTRFDKSATNCIKIVREIPFEEFLNLCTETLTYRNAFDAVSCTTEYVQGVRHGMEIYYHSVMNVDGKYGQGHMSNKCTYVNDQRDGVETKYYGNGYKQEETSFSADVRNGPYTSWYPHGVKRSQGVYIDGRPEGRFIAYDRAGEVIETD